MEKLPEMRDIIEQKMIELVDFAGIMYEDKKRLEERYARLAKTLEQWTSQNEQKVVQKQKKYLTARQKESIRNLFGKGGGHIS